MAKVKVKQVEPLEMEFADGTVRVALLNNEAWMIFRNEFGDMESLIENEAVIKPYSFLSKILYSGMKVVDTTVTLDEATYILLRGGENLAAEIARLMIDNFMNTASKEQQDLLLKEVEKFNDKVLGMLEN